MSGRDIPVDAAQMYQLCVDLFPITRSITGDGVRETLRRSGAPISRSRSTKSRRAPRRSTGRPARVEHPRRLRRGRPRRAGHRLRAVQPPRRQLQRAGARRASHWTSCAATCFSLPDRPISIPYRTSYYDESWGFCLAHDDAAVAARTASTRSCVDSSLEPGSLTYGECRPAGRATKRCCSRPTSATRRWRTTTCRASRVATFLGASCSAPMRSAIRTGCCSSPAPSDRSSGWLATRPTSAGSVTGWWSRASGTRGPSPTSGAGAATPTSTVPSQHVLRTTRDDGAVVDFSPYGYDERQFCSPGFDLPVGRLGRSLHGEYPEYHTSGDDLEFIGRRNSPDALDAVLDDRRTSSRATGRCVNQNPKCEPQLGRRGLYRAIGATFDSQSIEMAMLWVLNSPTASTTCSTSSPRRACRSTRCSAPPTCSSITTCSHRSRLVARRRVKIEPWTLQDVLVVESEPFTDDRGFFVRTMSAATLADAGSTSRGSSRRASRDRRRACCVASTAAPSLSEGKLVRCASGSVFEVILDLRPWSTTFLQWDTLVLDDVEHRQVWVPPGFVHGFQVLTDAGRHLLPDGRGARPVARHRAGLERPRPGDRVAAPRSGALGARSGSTVARRDPPAPRVVVRLLVTHLSAGKQRGASARFRRVPQHECRLESAYARVRRADVEGVFPHAPELVEVVDARARWSRPGWSPW